MTGTAGIRVTFLLGGAAGELDKFAHLAEDLIPSASGSACCGNYLPGLQVRPAKTLERRVIPQEAQYRAWMLAALAGDAAAYRMLLQGLTRHLRGYYARRLGPAAAEDAVQETLIAIHAKRATYDPARPFTAWVYGIARYKLIDEYRRSKRAAAVSLDDAGDLFDADGAEAASAKRDVEKLLAKLPAAKRDLVRAIKLDGHSIADEAARTGMSETSVKVTVHRALKSLGEELGDNHADR